MKKKTKIITTATITIISAILCAAILVTMIYQNKGFTDPSSANSMIVYETIIDNTSSENNTVSEQEVETGVTSITNSEQCTSTQTSSPINTYSSDSTSSSTPTTTASTPAPTTQLPTTVTTTLGTIPIGTTADITSPEQYAALVEEGKKYGGVRSPYANVGTGISWDGVTPILYTYEDGSTGHELREGAKYEVFPGLISTVYLSICFCSECGKASGNGTNGTCCQWLMGAINCPNCGVHVEVRTCHTCSK